MDIVEIVITALISLITVIVSGYILFRVTIEARLKDMENNLKLLEPMKDILLKKGSEHVKKVFELEQK
jgi:hypothetical protein